MTLTANLASRLAEVIGAHNVVSAPEELAAHAVDALVPQMIARPTSAPSMSTSIA